jgi:hypothetical protein
VAGQTGNSWSPLLSATQQYWVEAVNGNCSSTSRKTVTAYVHPEPVITATNNGAIAFGGSVVLSVGNYAYDTFQWLDAANNDSPISGATSSSYTVSVEGNFKVRVSKSSSLQFKSQNFSVGSAYSQNLNYIISNTILTPDIVSEASIKTLPVEKVTQTIQYFDGLGRLMQSVSTQGSPNKKDIVQPVVYDVFGREGVKYLPYTASGVGSNNGLFKNSALSEQSAFYNNTSSVATDVAPFSRTIFEPSPLNRVLEQGAPGAVWQPDATNDYSSTDHTLKKAYEFNLADEVLLWSYTSPTTALPLGLVNTGNGTTPVYYLANQLRKNKTKDEQHHEVIEYIDKEGHTLLKRVQATSTSNASTTDSNRDTNWASTYYIYDDFGNLVCVIPPEASRLLLTQYYQSGANDATKNDFLKRWTFRYVYDLKKRLIQKQVPGAEPVYMVYDKRDRLVMTQDGNQRSSAKKYWTFTKYDELNRPILTGIKEITRNATQAQMQVSVDSFYNIAGAKVYEQYVGNVANNIHGYTNQAYPTTTAGAAVNKDHYLTVTYYDRYDFKSQWCFVSAAAIGKSTGDRSGDRIEGQSIGWWRYRRIYLVKDCELF